MSDEGKLLHQERSPTAATLGNELYKPSGSMTYRVTVSNGSALTPVDVEAETGDEAARLALVQNPGCKVAHVAPAPQSVKKAA